MLLVPRRGVHTLSAVDSAGSPPPKPLGKRWIHFIVSTFGCVAVASGTYSFKSYGYALFLGIPVTMGLLLAFLYQHGRVWNWREVVPLTLYCLIWTALGLLLCRIEGMICILMAAVLVAGMVLAGVMISWSIQALVRQKRRRNQLHCLAFLCLPLMMKWDFDASSRPPLLEQTTVLEINAPPDQVWKYVPAFPTIPDPPEGWVSGSLAHPIRSEIDGEGPGATRRCVLSTGTMHEVVTQWEPAKLLEFVVIDTPPTMEERNPFGRVEAAHLKDYFRAHRGRFTLTALPDGRTRVEGTSWFSQDLWPQWYWTPIANDTVSNVHQRVLGHIKTLAEQD